LLFVALCGKGSAGKRVPAQIFAADPSIQEAFLEAYLEGDGHEYPKGKFSVTTVSRELAYGIALLVLRLGRLPSIYLAAVGVEVRIQGRSVRRHPEQFSVVWYRERGAAQKWHDTGRHFLIPVKSVAFEPFAGNVYNLEVEGEHTYLAGFCAVKNCQNALTSQALRDPVMGVPPQEVTPGEIVDLAERHRARILTSTYNEPLITSEWAIEVFREGRARGLVCSYVSNGNATPEVLDYLRPWVDLYKVDLKGFDDKHYRKLGGEPAGARRALREPVLPVVPGAPHRARGLHDPARCAHARAGRLPVVRRAHPRPLVGVSFSSAAGVARLMLVLDERRVLGSAARRLVTNTAGGTTSPPPGCMWRGRPPGSISIRNGTGGVLKDSRAGEYRVREADVGLG